MLISLFSTLISCGSSLIFALRKILPKGRMRGSFLTANVSVPIMGYLSVGISINRFTQNRYDRKWVKGKVEIYPNEP